MQILFRRDSVKISRIFCYNDIGSVYVCTECSKGEDDEHGKKMTTFYRVGRPQVLPHSSCVSLFVAF